MRLRASSNSQIFADRIASLPRSSARPSWISDRMPPLVRRGYMCVPGTSLSRTTNVNCPFTRVVTRPCLDYVRCCPAPWVHSCGHVTSLTVLPGPHQGGHLSRSQLPERVLGESRQPDDDPCPGGIQRGQFDYVRLALGSQVHDRWAPALQYEMRLCGTHVRCRPQSSAYSAVNLAVTAPTPLALTDRFATFRNGVVFAGVSRRCCRCSFRWHSRPERGARQRTESVAVQ